jgi:hypothetical protein
VEFLSSLRIEHVLEPPLSSGATSPIGSGNKLNMYLNPMVHDSIYTEDKNFTNERGGEDSEIIVSRLARL